MLRTILLLQSLILAISASRYGHFYNPYEYLQSYPSPYSHYVNNIPQYNPYLQPLFTNNFIEDKVAAAYLAVPNVMPTLNVIAEVPYSMSPKFTVVPMLVVSKDNMNLVKKAQILGVSKEKPVVIIKTENKVPLQCTPAVRIVLEKPIVVTSLKTNVVFPSDMQIVHEGYKIPIKIGAIIAPVLPDTYVSQESPLAIKIVYAIPTTPLKIDISFDVATEATPTSTKEPAAVPQQPEMTQPDYINNEDAVFVPETDAVVVESESDLPPKNVTIIEFPEMEAEPNLNVDEEDDELVNRNPPVVLAPAGIVQSTQPQTHVEPFHNPKESPFLQVLRDEAKKRF